MERPAMVIALDDALTRLARLDERRSTELEMLYYGGLSRAEAALALGVSESTVDRELKLAKAWLYRELGAGTERSRV